MRWSKHLVQAGGPAYVKLGQLIATAKGALPDPWTEAFAWCRDEVPSLKAGVAEAVIDAEFGHRRAETFESIDPVADGRRQHRPGAPGPLADGTEVAVKVQRPGLRQRFEADIRALAVIAFVADRLSKRARIANLPGFVELFAQLALEELDFRLEALNMVEIGLANEEAGLDHIRFPRPIPGLVTGRVLVMERMRGHPLHRCRQRPPRPRRPRAAPGVRGCSSRPSCTACSTAISTPATCSSTKRELLAGRLRHHRPADAAQRAAMAGW